MILETYVVWTISDIVGVVFVCIMLAIVAFLLFHEFIITPLVEWWNTEIKHLKEWRKRKK